MRNLIIYFTLFLSSLTFAQTNTEWLQQQMKRDDFWQRHTLVFIFSAQCPYCQQTAPVLKSWSMTHHIPVAAFSMSEVPLPDFEEAPLISKELLDAAFQNQSIQYPALFMMNQRTQALYPVIIGAFNEGELIQRIEVLIPKIKAYEGGVS